VCAAREGMADIEGVLRLDAQRDGPSSHGRPREITRLLLRYKRGGVSNRPYSRPTPRPSPNIDVLFHPQFCHEADPSFSSSFLPSFPLPSSSSFFSFFFLLLSAEEVVARVVGGRWYPPPFSYCSRRRSIMAALRCCSSPCLPSSPTFQEAAGRQEGRGR